MAEKKANTLEQLELLAARTKKENQALDARITEINGKGYQTASQVEESINAKLSSTYKAAGSIEAPNASYLVEANVGKVYNVSAAFTTDTSFVEGSGKKHPAGTNIVVVAGDSSDYKFDVLAGFVDLSDYAKTEDLPGEATTSKAGLLSATDKEKLDGITFATDQEVNAMLDKVFGSEAAE